MATNPRAILITGANRGIGLAILTALVQRTPHDIFILGSRSLASGTTAADQLHAKYPDTIIHPLALDVTSTPTIRTALQTISSTYGHLDVLVNNAGYAAIPDAGDDEQFRQAYADVFAVNVTSVAAMIELCGPLLQESTHHTGGMVIHVSSGRGSLGIALAGEMPRTVSMPYSISKTALNALTITLSQQPQYQGMQFHCVSPGHCKTAFNGFRGTRDPAEGAAVVVEIVNQSAEEKAKYEKVGFWETKGSAREVVAVPW